VAGQGRDWDSRYAAVRNSDAQLQLQMASVFAWVLLLLNSLCDSPQDQMHSHMLLIGAWPTGLLLADFCGKCWATGACSLLRWPMLIMRSECRCISACLWRTQLAACCTACLGWPPNG
jgi:hypothetical protein